MDRKILKSRRHELGLTLQEVADKIGVARATVQRYESGVIKGVEIEVLERLAYALETTPAYLMGWTDDERVSASAADPLRQDEEKLLADYNKLNRSGKEKAREYISDLTENNKYRTSAIAEAFAKAETKQIAAYKKKH